VLAKVFKINKLYYVSSDLNIKNINFINSTYLHIIQQIYTHVTGSTNLDSVFVQLNIEKQSGKNIIIITDGDCDPTMHSNQTNPFHEATMLDKSKSKYPNILDCNFVIINVKEKNMAFPYLNLDSKVCYLNGNNPKTIIGFIKALTISSKTNKPITPDLVLKCTLNLNELVVDKQIKAYSKVMSDSRIERMYTIFMKNIPKKKTISEEKANEQANSKNKTEIILTYGSEYESDVNTDSNTDSDADSYADMPELM